MFRIAFDGSLRRKIILIESYAKSRRLKNLAVKGPCGRCLSVLRPPPLLGNCLGWSSNFVGSEPGHIDIGV
jgi:hypothetical protein